MPPLSIDGSLLEINPLINSINKLLSNLSYILEKERRFTDFAAHELRTPIAILKTQAQTALKSKSDSERQMILEAQVRATDRAASLVDQLLALARLEHISAPTETLYLPTITEFIVREMRPTAEKAHIILDLELHATPFIHCNEELLSIVLSNLIDNAIKHTPAEGKILVSISMQDQMATLSVTDSGIGIPEDKLSLVTEAFYRVGGHQQTGAGLGLAIVKRAADILNAQFILKNNKAGHGLEALVQFKALTQTQA